MSSVEEYRYEPPYGSGALYNDCQPKEAMDDRMSDTIGFTVASSVLSLFGSVLTILPFVLWRDVRRSTTRLILLFLSIADFFTAAGYLLGGSARYYFFSPSGALNQSLVDQFRPLCAAQSFVISFFSTASFFWTTYLALYFVLVVVFGVYHWNRRLIVFFSVTAWCVPLVICVTAVSLEFLGIGETFINAAPGVCFVSSNRTILYNMSSEATFHRGVVEFFLFEAVSMKLWEMIAMVVISVCYLVIFVVNRCFLQKKLKRESAKSTGKSRPPSLSSRWSFSMSSQSASSYSKSLVVQSIKAVDFKLLLIPVVFIFFRAWGATRYFISIWSDCHEYLGPDEDFPFCVRKTCFDILYHPVLLYTQAIFDPLQGFGNAILFVILSKVIVTRFLSPFNACLKKYQKRHTHYEEYDSNISDEENESGPLVQNGTSVKPNGTRSLSINESSLRMSLADYPVLNV